MCMCMHMCKCRPAYITYCWWLIFQVNMNIKFKILLVYFIDVSTPDWIRGIYKNKNTKWEIKLREHAKSGPHGYFHVYARSHTQTCAHAHAQTRAHAHAQTHAHTNTRTHKHTHTNTCTRTRTRTQYLISLNFTYLTTNITNYDSRLRYLSNFYPKINSRWREAFLPYISKTTNDYEEFLLHSDKKNIWGFGNLQHSFLLFWSSFSLTPHFHVGYKTLVAKCLTTSIDQWIEF